MRTLKTAAALLAVAALAACDRAPERPLVRLVGLAAEQAAGESGGPVTLAEGIAVAAEPHHLDVDLSGARTGKLALTARGDALLLTLDWKLEGERRFQPYRRLSVPLAADGEEHLYQVDLSAEPYWTGAIDALRLTVEEGRLEIRELTARPQGSATRTTALGGLSLPSLPGLAQIDLELPPDTPREAVFEARLGLLPRFDREGVTARFRVWLEEGGQRRPWLAEEVAGGGGRGWQAVRREVEVPAGARLLLEVEAERGGRPLPEGAAVWGAPVVVGPGPPGPHLVVVVLDTVRADVVGAWSGAVGLTPHLDLLAAASVRLDQLHAPSPWTLPSVATLLTGLPPQAHGAGRSLGEDFAPTALAPVPSTLAETLADAGFYTAAVYNNIFLGPSFGVDRGFDEYDWVEQEDDVLVDRALALLDRAGDGRRLFLMLHLFGPHNPYAPPGDACDMARELLASEATRASEAGGTPPASTAFPGCSVDRRPGLPPPPEEQWPWVEALYRAEVAFTDRQVGRFLDGLEDRGLDGRTVLAVVSDHGEDFWGRIEEMQRRGYEDADHGHAHYQELLRVVGLLRAPGLEPAVIGEPVELADLAPTLLGLLGVDPPEGAAEGAGVDLGPWLAGGRMPRRAIVSDFLLYGEPRIAVRRGRWKLVAPRDEGLTGKERAPELYDLEQDPGETTDLYPERPDVAEALWRIGQEEIARREELRRRFGAGEDALDAAYLQWNHITKLRALGYLK